MERQNRTETFSLTHTKGKRRTYYVSTYIFSIQKSEFFIYRRGRGRATSFAPVTVPQPTVPSTYISNSIS